MKDFISKWFPSQRPNLVAKYKSDFIPPSYAYKKSMDRLKEIERKLDLLHEYLAYRADYIVRHNPYVTIHLVPSTVGLTPEQLIRDLIDRGLLYYSTISEPYQEILLDFEQWLTQWNKTSEDNQFVHFENKLGHTLSSRKLEGTW